MCDFCSKILINPWFDHNDLQQWCQACVQVVRFETQARLINSLNLVHYYRTQHQSWLATTFYTGFTTGIPYPGQMCQNFLSRQIQNRDQCNFLETRKKSARLHTRRAAQLVYACRELLSISKHFSKIAIIKSNTITNKSFTKSITTKKDSFTNKSQSYIHI